MNYACKKFSREKHIKIYFNILPYINSLTKYHINLKKQHKTYTQYYWYFFVIII